ncbi:MAG: Mg2+ and Co2+ transporter CorB, partial [Candidatus Lambdaproteobacteria bacterium]
DPVSIIPLETEYDLPVFPPFQRTPEDPFLLQVQQSGKKWVIITSVDGKPRLVLNADLFLRDALFGVEPFRPYSYCHRPIVVSDSATPLGEVIQKLRVHPEHSEDDVIDNDLILCWDKKRQIITGADILGRLLRGIAGRKPQFIIPQQK